MTRRVSYVRVGSTRVVRRIEQDCEQCSRVFEPHHGNVRLCPECRRERNAQYQRDYYQARKRQTPALRAVVVLGPCPCHDCGMALTWNGYAWEEVSGYRHVCERAA